jgi:hypothetical protein
MIQFLIQSATAIAWRFRYGIGAMRHDGWLTENGDQVRQVLGLDLSPGKSFRQPMGQPQAICGSQLLIR